MLLELEKCRFGTLVSIPIELRYPNSYFLKTAVAIAAHWCRSTIIKYTLLPGPVRFGPIFCQILPGEQRDLLLYSVRKLLFLSHNRNLDSNVPPRFVSTIRVMPISASFGFVSGWNPELLSPDLKNKNLKIRLLPEVFWWSSHGYVPLLVLLRRSLTEVSKLKKAARSLCRFQHFTTREGVVNLNVLVQGGCFPLCFAVMQLSRAKLNQFEGSILSRKGQICHTWSDQLIFQLRFKKKILLFNYPSLLSCL